MSEFNDVITKFVPAAYYRFSTGALTTDTGAGAHTLTDISDPAEDASGAFGGAVALDGNDAYSAADHADFQPTGAFTIGAWVKTTGTSDVFFQSWSYGDAGTTRAGIFIQTGSGGGIIGYSGKNTGTSLGTDYHKITGGTVVNDGEWHFVVFVWDGSYLRLYVDGVSDATAVAWANAPAYAATNYVRIGCSNNIGTNGSFLVGSLDDVFLLNGRALSSTDISNLYGTYPTAASTNYLKQYRRVRVAGNITGI